MMLGISETFLSQKDPDNKQIIEGYHKPERSDRKDKEGGGLLAYVSLAKEYIRRDDLETPNAEVMWLQIRPPKSENFLVGYVYRPPKTKAVTDRVIEENIENVLIFGTDVYILGDVYMDLL